MQCPRTRIWYNKAAAPGGESIACRRLLEAAASQRHLDSFSTAFPQHAASDATGSQRHRDSIPRAFQWHTAHQHLVRAWHSVSVASNIISKNEKRQNT